jgi:hypothetical protein
MRPRKPATVSSRHAVKCVRVMGGRPLYQSFTPVPAVWAFWMFAGMLLLAARARRTAQGGASRARVGHRAG